MFKNFDAGMVKYYLGEFSLKETKTMVEMDLYYETPKSDPPGVLRIWWEVLKSEIRDLVTLVLCNSVGHDYQDDSPPDCGESGAWAFSCSRCGFGHSGYMTG